ncbi:hypothetical protein B0H11DRAFT_2289681, partial [Mycena galericulata]
MTFILSIMKAFDIHSEGAVKLLAELLDLDAPGPYEEGGRHRNAEHFAHVEVYTDVRSPYRDLFVLCSPVRCPPNSGAFPRSRYLWNGGGGSERTRMIRQRAASVGHCRRYRYRPSPATCCFQRWLLVSASTHRLGRRSYGASARVGFHVYSDVPVA